MGEAEHARQVLRHHDRRAPGPGRTSVNRSLLVLALCGVLAACGTVRANKPPPERLTAKVYDSGFAQSHDSYNAISAASDGKIYYILSSESLDIGGQMYSFDPATKRVEHLGDLTE